MDLNVDVELVVIDMDVDVNIVEMDFIDIVNIVVIDMFIFCCYGDYYSYVELLSQC